MPKDFDSAGLYDFVLQQVVAEAYLDGLTGFSPDDENLRLRLNLGNNASQSNGYPGTRDALQDILPGATRLTASQIADFFQRFQIVDQHANDITGFSATLIRRKGTNEYTFAMRSTEFARQASGGDRERDIGLGPIPLFPLGTPATDAEIGRYGFALAQLSAMEEYYRQLRDEGKLPADATLDVAGYSLAGHLATVFTEYHTDEIRRTFVANGAGRGSILVPSIDLGTLIDLYRQMVADPEAGTLQLIDRLASAEGGKPYVEKVVTALQSALFAAAKAAPAIGWRTDGAWQAGNIYTNDRHQYAMAALDPILDGALWNSLFDGTQIEPEVSSKISYLVGIGTHDDDTMTANAGVTPSAKNWVFIEDQPDFYGDGGTLPEWLVGLLSKIGWTYQPGGFERTHSITLIADSLALMNVFGEADPALAKLDIETIFAAASNQRAVGNVWSRHDPTKSSAEADSLERALYALHKVLAPDPKQVRSLVTDSTADGFGHLANREAFYRELSDVKDAINAWRDPISGVSPVRITPLTGMDWLPIRNLVFRAVGISAYTVGVSPTQTTSSLADAALGDGPESIAIRYALREMNPFVVTGISYTEQNRDGSLDLIDRETGLLQWSRAYTEARAAMLLANIWRNISDTGYADGSAGDTLYDDRSLGLRVAYLDGSQPRIISSSELARGTRSDARDKIFESSAAAGLSDGYARLVAFGRNGGDEFVGGALADAMFGAGGDDVLDGRGGDDRLEGGAGSDRLSGGSGVDLLFGGAGDDQLGGGEDDGDVLNGGPGVDTYLINSGDGVDTIRDTGRNRIRWNGRVLSGVFEKDSNSATYRLLTAETALKDLTLSFNSAATLADGKGASLVLEGYASPEAFNDGGFGFTFVEELLDPVADSTIVGDNEANLLNGWISNDRILGLEGGDYIYAYSGDDFVEGGEGDDHIFSDGFPTDDPYFYSNYAYAEGGPAGSDVAVGGAGSDLIIAGAGDDRLYADRLVSLPVALQDQNVVPDPAKGDWLAAGEGDDVLIGSASSDVLTGGGGRDILVGGAGNDFLMGDASYVSLTDDWQFSVRADGTPAAFSTSNPSLNDPASSAADIIYGGAGDDWVWGGRGDDVIDGGAGKDLLFGNLGSDTIEGGDGDDVLAAGGRKQVDLSDLGDDYLSGDGGNDTLYGSAGDTLLFGGDGDDLLFAGPGDDVIDGGAGNDRISSGGGADLIEGGDGDDIVTAAGTEGASAYGGEGADVLSGALGEDALFGDAGDDVLTGDDAPTGDGASDLLDGGAGNDRYLVKPGSGVDEIYDESGEDVLEIQSIDAWPERAVARETIYLLDDDSGGISLAFGVLGDRAELGPDPAGVIERIEVNHYVGATFTIEVIQFAELWDAYVGPTVQGNTAPVIAQPLADAAVAEDQAFRHAIPADAFFDDDPDDVLTYTASLSGGGALPAWLSFDPVALVFFGVPANADVGSFEVTVTATDLAGESASTGFLVTIVNSNDAPQTAGSIAPQSVEEESRFDFALSPGLFTDDDAGETLLWSARLVDGAQLPGWLSFDPQAKAFSGTPTRAAVGELTVVVGAEDLAGASTSLAFSLSVTKALGKTLSGSAGSELLQGGPGDDTLLGSPGADALIGDQGDDTFVLASDAVWSAGYGAYNAGSPGNPGTGRIVAIQDKSRLFDTVDGGDGFDTVQGTAGHDAVFLDDSLSPFPGAAGARFFGVERFLMGAGNDVVDLTSFDFALGTVRIEGEDGDDLLWASAGDDTLLGGAGQDQLYGGAGADYLAGGAGDDSLEGSYGADALQGGEGNDALEDLSGGALLDGGAGNDALTGSASADLLAGGRGNDSLRPGGGSDVVLFNRGDGADRIAAGPGAKTLSLGGGIAYEDLALERTGSHLVVHLGHGEMVELTDWYASVANTGFRYMQVITEAMGSLGPAGGDMLRDEKVERFDFRTLVGAFDAARSADAMMVRWQVMDTLLDAHLVGSDDEALGGELAYRYGLTGTLAGQSVDSAKVAVASPDFGSKPQPVASSVGVPGEALLG